MQNTKYLWALGTAILLGGILYFQPSPEKNSTPLSDEVKTYTVDLTKNGFNPKEIAIDKGDSIIFTTSRGKIFWPASDLHPSHHIYPEFDPKEPLEPSSTWTFKFDKAGTWRYHDHLAPIYKGAVIVKERDKDIKVLGTKANCLGETSEKYKCWEDAINLSLDKDGLDAALTTMASFYAADPSFDCHAFAHTLGENAYPKFAREEHLDITTKTAYCGYGFYHGFMETLLLTTGNPHEARKFCEYVELELAEETTDGRGSCYHGIGHGAVDGGDPTAWGNAEAMIAPGMKTCKVISENDSDLYRCITGVFNAIEILSMDNKYKLLVLQKDPFSLCHNQPANYREGCYTNMLPALMRNHTNFKEAAKIIENTVKNDADYKIRGMVILGLFHEPIRIELSKGITDYTNWINLCHELKEESRLHCIGGLSRGFMKYGEPQKEYIKALQFCKNPALRGDEKEVCYENILGILRIFYSADKTNSICETVEDKYKKYCPK